MRKRDSKVAREKAKATAAVRTRTRNRHDDVKSLGPSRLVPYDPAEPDSDRHRRRLRSAAEHKGSVATWGYIKGIGIRISEDSQHWTFAKHPHVAEWWPSSAKLVFDRQYARGIHAHDVEQVKAEITRRWGLAT